MDPNIHMSNLRNKQDGESPNDKADKPPNGKDDKPPTEQDSRPPPCKHCETTVDWTGRNLILSFDGTSNQYGTKNTNVIELYSRIIKDENQLTYYNSGIGTYAKPSWRSFKYWKQVINNKIDLAIAWNFEKGVLAGYRWLSNHYKPGDRIFLFGFSRGAYQVRTLAGMIDKVGLILPGNEEQIPFAYELYADLKINSKKKAKQRKEVEPEEETEELYADLKINSKKKAKEVDPEEEAEECDLEERDEVFFKETFSQKDVKVHFLGAWDTVSSIGIVKTKSLPGTDEFNDKICYFRHALALDERRVKFLPEYIRGGESYIPATEVAGGTLPGNDSPNRKPGDGFISAQSEGKDPGDKVRGAGITAPRVKEVWFAGCHSDIGGGSKANRKLDNADVPVLWMGNEAMLAGLKLSSPKQQWIRDGQWRWEDLENKKPAESLRSVWRLFEVLPFSRLSYADKTQITRWPHLSKGRVIKPGQKIHASVAFIKNYTPKATFEDEEKTWSYVLGKGEQKGIAWANGIEDMLELDLFDHSIVNEIIRAVRANMKNSELTGRLKFFASTPEGAQAIATADLEFGLFCEMLKHGDNQVKVACLEILTKLITYGALVSLISQADVIPGLTKAMEDGDRQVKITSLRVVSELSRGYKGNVFASKIVAPLFRMINHNFLEEREDAEEAVKVLYKLVQRSDAWKTLTQGINDSKVEVIIENLLEHGRWGVLTVAGLSTDDSIVHIFKDMAIWQYFVRKDWDFAYHEERTMFKAFLSLVKHYVRKSEIIPSDIFSWGVNIVKGCDVFCSNNNADDLSQLVENGSVREGLLVEGFMDVLIDRIGNQSFALRVLSAMAKYDDARKYIRENMVHALEKAISSNDEFKQCASVQAIGILAQYGEVKKILNPRTLKSIVNLFKRGRTAVMASCAKALVAFNWDASAQVPLEDVVQYLVRQCSIGLGWKGIHSQKCLRELVESSKLAKTTTPNLMKFNNNGDNGDMIAEVGTKRGIPDFLDRLLNLDLPVEIFVLRKHIFLVRNSVH